MRSSRSSERWGRPNPDRPEADAGLCRQSDRNGEALLRRAPHGSFLAGCITCGVGQPAPAETPATLSAGGGPIEIVPGRVRPIVRRWGGSGEGYRATSRTGHPGGRGWKLAMSREVCTSVLTPDRQVGSETVRAPEDGAGDGVGSLWAAETQRIACYLAAEISLQFCRRITLWTIAESPSILSPNHPFPFPWIRHPEAAQPPDPIVRYLPRIVDSELRGPPAGSGSCRHRRAESVR